ncbi:hypothetical protein L599_000300000170 [Luteimonas sp. J16]|jgi:hypothetical protein|uniref:hypothetical protein n=1 Tax=unclassified Luteimonas TaxID=2629088 RepID=UPI0004BA611E|nr:MULTISPECIES: hypothetical protein [unclassified Luteimonas]TWG90703.1 hypothetical protein L599_000300000170 [Luteimonas sp. J16]
MSPRPFAIATLALLLLAGCRDREAEAAAQAAAIAAANEQAAVEAEKAFDAAVADGNWALAKAQGDIVFARWPDTEAAARLRPRYEEARAKGQAEVEARRLAALWTYQSIAVKGGQQVSAAIHAKDPLDVDGSGPRPVQLIFRDHPEWGRSSYLVLKAGDFARPCYRGCRVKVTVDEQPPRNMAANRPDTDEAIAMFIEDEKALWRMLRDASVLRIEFPTRDAGTQVAEFEVGGLDRARMPKWD